MFTSKLFNIGYASKADFALIAESISSVSSLLDITLI